jgi:hypothetical protein
LQWGIEDMTKKEAKKRDYVNRHKTTEVKTEPDNPHQDFGRFVVRQELFKKHKDEKKKRVRREGGGRGGELTIELCCENGCCIIRYVQRHR